MGFLIEASMPVAWHLFRCSEVVAFAVTAMIEQSVYALMRPIFDLAAMLSAHANSLARIACESM